MLAAAAPCSGFNSVVAVSTITAVKASATNGVFRRG